MGRMQRRGHRGDRITRRSFLAGSAALLASAPGRAQPRPAPFEVIGLNHVSLGVSNLERAQAFYQRLFDLTVYTRQGNGSLPILTIGSGPQFVALSELTPRQAAAAGIGHHFSVHIERFDPDVVVERLAGVGVTARVNMRPAAAQRPAGAPEQDTPELLFNDPDGILLQIQDVRYCGGIGLMGDECGIPDIPPPRAARAPFRVQSLNHVAVGVSDVPRALEFYQRVFGGTVHTSQAEGAVPVLSFGPGRGFVVLRQGDSDGHHFCLGIDPFDPDDVMAMLDDLGVPGRLRIRPASEQRPAQPGAVDTPEITIEDPDGHVVQLQDVSYCGGVGPLGSVC